MCAYVALSLKDISHTQLSSAGRFFLKGEERNWVGKADKQQLVNVLALWFVQSGVVVIKEGSDISNLSCDDVFKDTPF